MGSRLHPARLAGALLGKLLMRLANWMTPRMLEMSYGLEPDRGGVDYLAAGYVRGAKSKRRRATSALREILDAGHDDSVQLATPAVGRAINNERIRLRCTIGGSARPIAQGHSASRRIATIAPNSLTNPRFACWWQAVGPTIGSRHGARPNCLQAWMPGETVGGAAR